MTRATLLTCGLLLHHLALMAEPIAVRGTEGIVHGFLVLRTLDGKRLADGDLIQVPRGGQVTARLRFRFEDGSIHEESAVYTQRRYFRLLTSRLVQKGPTFPRALDMSIRPMRSSASPYEPVMPLTNTAMTMGPERA